MDPIKQSMTYGLLEDFGYIPCLCFKYPFCDIFQTRNKVLTKHSDNLSIEVSCTELSQGRLCFISKYRCLVELLIVQLQLALRGCHTPSPPHTHSHPTAMGLLIIDSKRRSSIILSVLAVFMFTEWRLHEHL